MSCHVGALPGLAHVVERHDHLQVELLARARVDEPDRARARHEAADLVHRPLRRREADALERRLVQRARAARPSAPGARRASCRRPRAPRRGSACRRRAGSRARAEVSIRKSDSGVVIRMSGGSLTIASALLLRRVAGAHADAQLGLEARERAAQVALDVVVQRLQRRDVDQAQALARRRGSAGRSRRGTRRASCPSRSAPGSGRARRWRSPASRAPGQGSAPRTRSRTRRASSG